MIYTYKLNDANVKLKRGKFNIFGELRTFAHILRRMFLKIVVLLFTFILTWMVFDLNIQDGGLTDNIALGAIFATLGSAIVSVFTLFCGEQYSQFDDNSKIFQEQLIGVANWRRWPFVKRKRKYRISRTQYEIQTLENPSITFFDSTWRITIPLPASKADFYELSILIYFIKLKCNRKKYRSILDEQRSPDAIKEILLWDCLTSIYSNIVLYRSGKFFSLLGGSFVFSSIFFSFFYGLLPNILNRYF